MFGFETLGKFAMKEETEIKIMATGTRGRKVQLFCDDKSFDQALSIIKIEHCLECPIFGEKGHQIFKILSEKFTRNKFKLLLNESEIDGKKIEPRLGAFEVSFARNCKETYHLIWSGIDKGPPRREKFPKDFEQLTRQIQKILVTG